MTRGGFRNDTIAKMKATVGEDIVERTLREIEAKRPIFGIHAFRHEPIVYYMRMDRLIKIGTTTNIRMRSGSIMPQGVLAVEWGDRLQERRRHMEFDDYHSHLEWYWLRERLWEHIQQLRDGAPETLGSTIEEWLAVHGMRHGMVEGPEDE